MAASYSHMLPHIISATYHLPAVGTWRGSAASRPTAEHWRNDADNELRDCHDKVQPVQYVCDGALGQSWEHNNRQETLHNLHEIADHKYS